jgi:hypothetical protein
LCILQEGCGGKSDNELVYERCNQKFHTRNCAYSRKVSRSNCTQSSVTFRSVDLSSYLKTLISKAVCYLA